MVHGCGGCALSKAVWVELKPAHGRGTEGVESMCFGSAEAGAGGSSGISPRSLMRSLIRWFKGTGIRTVTGALVSVESFGRGFR